MTSIFFDLWDIFFKKNYHKTILRNCLFFENFFLKKYPINQKMVILTLLGGFLYRGWVFMQITFKEVSFMVITGTSVIVILVIAFITTLVCCNRRITITNNAT